MPDNCRNCGDCSVPAAKITSRTARRLHAVYSYYTWNVLAKVCSRRDSIHLQMDLKP